MDNTLRISLAAARVNAGLTQSKVAEMMHISKATIVNWENGNTFPTSIQFKEICDLYKIPMDFIRLPENQV